MPPVEQWTFGAHITMSCESSQDRRRFVEMLFLRIAMVSSFHNCLAFVSVVLGYKDNKV